MQAHRRCDIHRVGGDSDGVADGSTVHAGSAGGGGRGSNWCG